MPVKFKWKYKCVRCKRPIKTGQEVWLHNEPYGEFCYRIVCLAEIKANDLLIKEQ